MSNEKKRLSASPGSRYILLTPGASPNAWRAPGHAVPGTPEGFELRWNGRGYFGWTDEVFVAYFASEEAVVRALSSLTAAIKSGEIHSTVGVLR